jgi:hypothetical protein
VKIELVAAALKGLGVSFGGMVPIGLCTTGRGHAESRAKPGQGRGPVETVVDRALLALQDGQALKTPRVNSRQVMALAYCFGHRALLDRLRSSRDRPSRQATVGTCGAGESAAWLAGWLIQPAVGLGGLPIDIVLEPGGLDRVNEQLQRIMLNPGGLRD